jgi:hypothetical protein
VNLTPVPPRPSLAATRRSWHVLAGHVLAEERFLRVGHSGLEPTPHGMRTSATEPVGVEVDLDHLVVRRDGGLERRPITTLGEAQRFALGTVGAPSWGAQPGLHDPPETLPPDTPLPIDVSVAGWLGAWLTLGQRTLQQLVADAASVDAGVPTLWAEHFDVGVELLADDRRASYGISPGDAAIDEPYAYVAVWYPDRIGGLEDPAWNSAVITGAVITARELVEASDAGDGLLSWLRTRRDLLAGT